MRNFKQLNSKEQTKAIDKAFEKLIALDSYRKKYLTESQQNKFDKIARSISNNLCGCFTCISLIKTDIINNQQFKEVFIITARKLAEVAYYSDTDDLIVEL